MFHAESLQSRSEDGAYHSGSCQYYMMYLRLRGLLLRLPVRFEEDEGSTKPEKREGQCRQPQNAL